MFFFKFFLGTESGLHIQQKIQKFTIHHNNSPSTTTWKFPSEVIVSYNPKTLLDAVNMKYKGELDSFKLSEVARSVDCKFSEGQRVMYRNHFKSLS